MTAVCIAAAIVLAAGSPDGAPSAVGAAPAPHPSADRLLPCTTADQPTNYTAYSLGKAFEGLEVTNSERVCTQPNPQLPLAPHARINIVEYIYGDCTIPEGMERCKPPLAVQVWPRCERDPANYEISHHNPLHGKTRIRGVAAHLYEGGHRLEIYTGDSTVVLFGKDRAQLMRAGRNLVKAPTKPSTPVTEGDPSGDLPPAAADSCS